MKSVKKLNALARALGMGLATIAISGCVTISAPVEEPSPIPPSATASTAVQAQALAPVPEGEPELDLASPTAEPEPEGEPTATLIPTATPEPKLYTVVAGDTLSIVARKHAIPLDALMRLNNLTDADRLSIDQLLIIPSAGQIVGVAAAAATGTPVGLPRTTEGHVIHYVQVGETLSVIAGQYGVEREDVLRANGLRPDAQLTAGDTIIIPQGEYAPVPTATVPPATAVPTLVVAFEPSITPIPPTSTPAPTATPLRHVVQPGEIAGTIARDNGITVGQLAAANPGATMDSLQIGQSLLIPRTGEAVLPTATPLTVDPTATPTTVPPLMATHIVAEGESLATIASRYSVLEAELRSYNPGLAEPLATAAVVQVPLGTPTPTPSPTAMPTMTPTPAPAYLAPTLLLPATGSTWVHWEGKQPLQLLWTASGILKDNEFYVVRLRAVDDAGAVTWSQTHWSQSPHWRLPEELLRAIPSGSMLRWDVMVMRRTSDPTAARAEGIALSHKSQTYEIRFSYSNR